jgi:hypothetical protein
LSTAHPPVINSRLHPALDWSLVNSIPATVDHRASRALFDWFPTNRKRKTGETTFSQFSPKNCYHTLRRKRPTPTERLLVEEKGKQKDTRNPTREKGKKRTSNIQKEKKTTYIK